jgi:hypothetical protein
MQHRFHINEMRTQMSSDGEPNWSQSVQSIAAKIVAKIASEIGRIDNLTQIRTIMCKIFYLLKNYICVTN